VGFCIGALLFAEIAFVCIRGNLRVTAAVHRIDAQAVGIALFGPYKAAVIAVSFILLAGLIGAFHLGRPSKTNEEAR
jgi:NADH-quinone oxidoreductase subunit J